MLWRVNRHGRGRGCIAAVALITVAWAVPSAAQQSSSRFALHGYGHVAGLGTTPDEASDGDDDSHDYDVSLLGTVRVSDKVSAWLQGAHLSEISRPRLDWAFVRVDVTPATTVYLGQPRMPVAFSNELRDVQALRASASLPTIYDDDLGLADEALRGGVLEHRARGRAWGDLTVEAFGAAQVVPDVDRVRTGTVAGGRVAWTPAGSAWTHKVSGYAGRLRREVDDDAPAVDDAFDHKRALVLSSRLEQPRWALQSEFGVAHLVDHRLLVGYVQMERQVFQRWRAFTRFDLGQLDYDGDTSSYRRLSAGVGYRLPKYAGVRLELTRNRGRLDDDGDDGAATRVIASVNFVF